MCFFEQISGNERFTKSFFSIFSCPHRKKIQKILIRPILTFDALPIAHFEAYVPNFLKHLWKLAISLKLWVPAHFEVGWARTVSAKIGVFRPLFWRKKLFHQFDPTNTPKCYTWLESYRSPLNDGKEKKLFFSPCEASDFRGRTSTDFQTLAETASY